MGFVALNTRTDDGALAQRTITLQPAVSFDTKFFFYFMMSVHFQNLVKLNATGAAAVGMKGSKVRTLPLPFPAFGEQHAIVSKLDDLLAENQHLESIYQQKLAALDALKRSLLRQAFTGAL
jgi:type I restriction enzyme S subunit